MIIIDILRCNLKKKRLQRTFQNTDGCDYIKNANKSNSCYE